MEQTKPRGANGAKRSRPSQRSHNGDERSTQSHRRSYRSKRSYKRNRICICHIGAKEEEQMEMRGAHRAKEEELQEQTEQAEQSIYICQRRGANGAYQSKRSHWRSNGCV